MNDKELNNLFSGITSELEEVGLVIILEGSYAWGQMTRSQEVDLEVIISDFWDLENHINNIVSDRTLLEPLYQDTLKGLGFIKKIRDYAFDILQVKAKIKHLKIGMRFIKLKSFQRICKLDLLGISESVYLLSLRPKVKVRQARVYSQRNFAGKQITIPKKFEIRDGKQITWVPAAIIDETGCYFPGSLIDRYICGAKVIYDPQKIFTKSMATLKRNLIKRLRLEQPRYKKGKHLGFDQMLTRYKQVPNELKKRLKQETKYWLSKVK